ncbi:hypothetical protein HHK36_006161 [Tetracentron sinense]|uniref:Late embryogenesis abundant protein LEA-2 subgroup domain-containing protein n=1 Tax=Tetracentron sinense TaxID=13715 RepID=A0A834ZHK0_TETSI|nr:hypothetical protein HHK36_006161 [Tetracentron sinense]
MAAKGEAIYYSPLPPPQEQQHYVILSLYSPPNRRRRSRRCLLCFASLVLLAVAIFFLWPSDPDLSVVRLHLNHLRIQKFPFISLDISLPLTIKVRNRDFFSLDYNSLVVSIGYRGKQLGFVNSNQGHVRARGSSYVNATLQFDGIELLFDTFYLLEDLAKGSIAFDTVSEVKGKLGLFFFDFPLKDLIRSYEGSFLLITIELLLPTEMQYLGHCYRYPVLLDEGKATFEENILVLNEDWKMPLLRVKTHDDAYTGTNPDAVSEHKHTASLIYHRHRHSLEFADSQPRPPMVLAQQTISVASLRCEI